MKIKGFVLTVCLLSGLLTFAQVAKEGHPGKNKPDRADLPSADRFPNPCAFSI